MGDPRHRATRGRIAGVAQLLGSGKLVPGELVEPLSYSLRGAAVIDEDDRRGVFLDQLKELWIDGRPN
jgi:hypothetical protein